MYIHTLDYPVVRNTCNIFTHEHIHVYIHTLDYPVVNNTCKNEHIHVYTDYPVVRNTCNIFTHERTHVYTYIGLPSTCDIYYY